MRHQLILILTFFLNVTSHGTAGEREGWTTSRVIGSPDEPKPFSVQRVYPNLQFKQPVKLTAVPGTNKNLEVTGKLFAFDNDPACEKAELVVDFNP